MRTQARGLKPVIPPRCVREITTVVVHCSATPSGQYLRGEAPAVIDDWHFRRGFLRNGQAREKFNPDLAAIGYHYVIDIDGQLWTGRHVDEIGAHVAGYNAGSLGVCLVGGAEPRARYTLDQWQALAELVPKLQALCYTLRRVVGHRDLSPDLNGDGKIDSREWTKTCPGFDVGAWLAGGMAPLASQMAKAA